MDTISCKHCACRYVCVVKRNVDKGIDSGVEPKLVILSRTDDIKHRVYKLLADECSQYRYIRRKF